MDHEVQRPRPREKRGDENLDVSLRHRSNWLTEKGNRDKLNIKARMKTMNHLLKNNV